MNIIALLDCIIFCMELPEFDTNSILEVLPSILNLVCCPLNKCKWTLAATGVSATAPIAAIFKPVAPHTPLESPPPQNLKLVLTFPIAAVILPELVPASIKANLWA